MKWIIRIPIVLVLLIGTGLWHGWTQLDKLFMHGMNKARPGVKTSVSVENGEAQTEGRHEPFLSIHHFRGSQRVTKIWLMFDWQ